jgi:hypothetical protein
VNPSRVEVRRRCRRRKVAQLGLENVEVTTMRESVDVVARRQRLHVPARLGAAAVFVAASWLAAPARAQTPEPSPSPSPPDWKFSGDFRLRWERTSHQQPTSDPLVLEPRNRWVVRGRAGVTKKFGDHTTFGARLRTGDPDDPNSSDITLGDFADSLQLSLDRAFVEVRHEAATFTGGKFVNPFDSTELVWDGDVNPQGVAVSLGGSGSGRVAPKLVGLFYVVDEATINPDSYMGGGQGQVTLRPSSAWSVRLGAGYYNYTIKSLRNADAGDTRSNRLTPDRTAYLSDFDLLDGVVTISHRGFGKRYPIQLVADYVKNLGADDLNEGFGVDLFVGRAAEKGDMRFRYGYSEAETDAILAAFSHDNTTLPSNYEQHTLTYDYLFRKDFQLNVVWYVYRKLDAEPTDPNPWLNRLRLNALVTF